MGYSTDFTGSFKLNKPLDDKLHEYLTKFSSTRRMKRLFDDDQFGVDGEFYVDGSGYAGQEKEPSIVSYNSPPRTQPGLWCQWIPSDDKMSIQWDGGEKFYDYKEWIVYIIQNFLQPNGYVLNGSVEYQGEESNDYGTLIITDNVLYESVKNYTTLHLYNPTLCRSQLDSYTEQKLLVEHKNETV